MTEIFKYIINMSLTASWVILGVITARLLMKNLPKRFSYMLWAIVAFRLCMPVSLESKFSIFNFDALKQPQAVSGTKVLQSAVSTQSVGVPQSAAVSASKTQAATSVDDILAYIWLCGIAVLLVYSIISYLRVRRGVWAAIPYTQNIYRADSLSSPFVLGFIKPRIYIPFGLSENEEEYVLLHEQHHIERRDHLIKLFAFLLLCVHWFNPICWAAFILMSRDMEMSCDEWVLEKGTAPKEYSLTLLSFAANKRFTSPGFLSFGEVSARSRIKNVLKWKRSALWITVLAVVICICTVTVFATDGVSGEDKKTSSAVSKKNDTAVSAVQQNVQQPAESDTTIPFTDTPETDIPKETVPEKETAVPETTPPETTVPETTVPETTVPDTVPAQTDEIPGNSLIYSIISEAIPGPDGYMPKTQELQDDSNFYLPEFDSSSSKRGGTLPEVPDVKDPGDNVSMPVIKWDVGSNSHVLNDTPGYINKPGYQW